MRWVAPTEKDTANQTLEKRLWDAADQFRANSGLKAGQYSTPVLGLIFLRFAEARFAQRRAQLEKAGARRVTTGRAAAYTSTRPKPRAPNGCRGAPASVRSCRSRGSRPRRAGGIPRTHLNARVPGQRDEFQDCASAALRPRRARTTATAAWFRPSGWRSVPLK